jgi:type I site-specific restriction-modification system R (restriction) subunit
VHLEGGCAISRSQEVKSLRSRNVPKLGEVWPNFQRAFLVCAEKFQTGYDEPLLHTMYVDKVLSGIKAVQTLSRLNRAHPKKHDVFVLDFQNDTEMIEKSFADYYRTTVLSKETDPNKLHTLKGDLDSYQVYSPELIDGFSPISDRICCITATDATYNIS